MHIYTYIYWTIFRIGRCRYDNLSVNVIIFFSYCVCINSSLVMATNVKDQEGEEAIEVEESSIEESDEESEQMHLSDTVKKIVCDMLQKREIAVKVSN